MTTTGILDALTVPVDTPNGRMFQVRDGARVVADGPVEGSRQGLSLRRDPVSVPANFDNEGMARGVAFRMLRRRYREAMR